MEKNLQDGFDKFLRKSFEGYEETPTNDVWEGISGDLDKPLPSTPKQVPFYKTWWSVAAAAAVVGIVAGQFLYFQNRIDDLTEKVDNQKVKIETIDKIDINRTESEESSDLKKSEILSPEANKLIVETQNELKPEIKNSDTYKLNDTQNSKPAEPEKFNSDNQLVPIEKKSELTSNESMSEHSVGKNEQVRITDKLPPSDSPKDGNLSNLNIPERSIADENSEINSNKLKNEILESPEVLFGIKQIELPTLLKNRNFEFLTNKSDLPESATISSFQLPHKIKPVRKTDKGIAIGATVGFYKTTETLNRNLRDAFIQNPPPPPHVRAVHQNKKSTGKTYEFGLNLNFGLSKKWSFSSGLLYRKSEFDLKNEVNFKFKDFKRRPGTEERDFAIVVNTGVGATHIEARAIPEPDTKINDQEKINIDIVSNRTTEYISVPLSAQYNFDASDWRFGLEAGILANFLIKSDLNVSSINISHPKLRPGHLNRPRQNFTGVKNNTIDGVLGFDLAYKLSDKWSLSLSPTIIFDLTNKYRIPQVDSDSYSVGIKTGFMYHL